MVRAVSVYNKDKVIRMGKKMRNRSMIGAIIFSVLLVAMGVFNVVIALTQESGPNWLATALGVVVALLSFYPIYKAINTNKKNVEETIKSMRLNKGDLTLEFLIKEKRIEITATQNETVQTETLMIKNVTGVRPEKEGVGICVGEDMYYIENGDIVQGNREMLLNIFKRAGFNIKKK
ncbi:MAG: hypothetical protein IKL82_02015 [Clostridia bacterium]|nr:hypothetical protein [Clostridia bacterium]